MEGRAKPQEPADPDQSQFTFVLGQDQQSIRSQAMRHYWKQRHHRQNLTRRISASQASSHRPLLPKAGNGSSNSSLLGPSPTRLASQPESNEEQAPADPSMLDLGSLALDSHATTSSRSSESPMFDGIPAQLMGGLNHAIACSRLDPFDMFPVKLTAQHHKLLHHWLGTYATMMFDQLPKAAFNPVRDVWFPLDLSNAASFNAIMAHSAAHLSSMRGIKNSKEALRFKVEAVRIVREWMGDPILALSDDMFSAVLRLLTYERYWGTETEWRLHRDGLKRMVEVSSGIEALQRNWRLELIMFLVSLMSKPSWFDSTNQIREISQPAPEGEHHSITGNPENLHRIRCLWLISFMQDLRTFTRTSLGLRFDGLCRYANVHDAVLLLQSDMHRQMRAPVQDEPCSQYEFGRLSCVFLISILFQESASTTHTLPALGSGDCIASLTLSDLAMLDILLEVSRSSWQHSVDGLRATMFDGGLNIPDSSRKTEYVLHITNVLGSMSSEARRGVERCVLHVLSEADDDAQDLSLDDDWSPDTLLSSSHGL